MLQMIQSLKIKNNGFKDIFFFFFWQNLSQTHMLIDLIQEVKEKGHKIKICPPVEMNLVQYSSISSPSGFKIK